MICGHTDNCEYRADSFYELLWHLANTEDNNDA